MTRRVVQADGITLAEGSVEVMTMNPTGQMALDWILGDSRRDERRTIDAMFNDIMITHSRARDYQR
jgi:hypothetical protein